MPDYKLRHACLDQFTFFNPYICLMAKKTSSDKAWERFGKEDPYFGVITDHKFKRSNLTPEAVSEFFESGRDHVRHVTDVFASLSGKKTERFGSVLDFGCGTGRLVIPFAAIADNVTGVDVSASMLAEAGENLKRFKTENVELIESNSLESLQDRKFSLVHSFIVLQHIPVTRGYTLIRDLLNLIDDGGYGMIHITYSNELSARSNIRADLRSRYPFVSQFLNLIKGRHPDAPFMQMNSYNLNKVFRMIETFAPEKLYIELTNHGGFHGVCLYVLK